MSINKGESFKGCSLMEPRLQDMDLFEDRELKAGHNFTMIKTTYLQTSLVCEKSELRITSGAIQGYVPAVLILVV